MPIATNPNWLVFIGIVYAAFGAILIASLLLFPKAARSEAEVRSDALLPGLAGVLLMAGFLFQGIGQFNHMPLNGFVPVALVALIAVLGVAGVLAPAAWKTKDDDAGHVPVAAQPASVEPRSVPAEPPVKLVSSTG